MTTAVVVKTHGWEVRVDSLDPKTNKVTSTVTVPKNSEYTTHIHKGMNVLISEVPNKEA